MWGWSNYWRMMEMKLIFMVWFQVAMYSTVCMKGGQTWFQGPVLCLLPWAASVLVLFICCLFKNITNNQKQGTKTKNKTPLLLPPKNTWKKWKKLKNKTKYKQNKTKHFDSRGRCFQVLIFVCCGPGSNVCGVVLINVRGVPRFSYKLAGGNLNPNWAQNHTKIIDHFKGKSKNILLSMKAWLKECSKTWVGSRKCMIIVG